MSDIQNFRISVNSVSFILQTNGVNAMLEMKTPLIAEFLKDHQQFSRLLYEISKLLNAGDIEKARERALELDAVAGPHIAYEEAELYTRLANFGEASVTEADLVGEHNNILNSLRMLIEKTSPTDAELESIKSGFRLALAHAEHCGSLISLMSRLNEQEQTNSLATLLGLRKVGKKWTES